MQSMNVVYSKADCGNIHPMQKQRLFRVFNRPFLLWDKTMGESHR